MKIILSGCTGTAGSQVLRQCLVHPSIDSIVVLSRRPLPAHILATSPAEAIQRKLKVVLQTDFSVYPSTVLDQLQGSTAAVWCLGKSANGMTEPDYTLLSHDYPLVAAKAFASLTPAQDTSAKFVFVYLSGAGSDQEEKARVMFGRIKGAVCPLWSELRKRLTLLCTGRAEKALACLNLPNLATYSFRPALIYPIEPTPEANLLQRASNAVVPVIKLFSADPSFMIDTKELAEGMIVAALKGGQGSIPGWPGKGQVGNANVFENEEIKRLVREKGAL